MSKKKQKNKKVNKKSEEKKYIPTLKDSKEFPDILSYMEKLIQGKIDALKSVMIPTVEVHITDVNQREDYRKISYVKEVAKLSIVGHGLKGYIEAIDYLVK